MITYGLRSIRRPNRYRDGILRSNVEQLEDRLAPGSFLGFGGNPGAGGYSSIGQSFADNTLYSSAGHVFTATAAKADQPGILSWPKVANLSMRPGANVHDGTATAERVSPQAKPSSGLESAAYPWGANESNSESSLNIHETALRSDLSPWSPNSDGKAVSRPKLLPATQYPSVGSISAESVVRPTVSVAMLLPAVNTLSNVVAPPIRPANVLASTVPAIPTAFVPLDAGMGSVPGVAADTDATVEDRRVPRGLAYPDDVERDQLLTPYSISYDGANREPTTGVVRSPAEYDPVRGVLFSYTSYASIVTDMVKELTQNPAKDEIAYVVVSSVAQQNSATTSFTNAGANLSKVQFFIQPSNSVWIRDYGPHFVTVDDTLAMVDSHYYPNRPLDNFIPTLLGTNNFKVPTYDMGLYYSGGNFQPGPNRSAFATSLVNYHNTATDGFNASFISELYHRYQGIDTLHVLPQLPFSVDGTGHIDMWMYLVDADTVVISEFAAGSNSTAIQITNNAVSYMQGLGFNVVRTPAWNVGSTHYTYANAFRVNDRIFVPVYGTVFKPGGNASYNNNDATAMAAWQAAAGPGVEIVPIQSNQIISAAGAIHCIVKQVPRYTGSAPAVNVVSPAGGEILLTGSQTRIEWSAIDTDNVDPTEIRIYVSHGDRDEQLLVTTTDTGSYLWNVTGIADEAKIRIVARSADGDETEAFSKPFSIARGRATVYDFATGAGIDKFAYGWQTNAWSDIQGNMSPISNPLSSAAYIALATSNATGGNADTNRYIAPTPSPVSNESTHVFTFQLGEAPTAISQLDVRWEGYADFCTQVELYVWDRQAQNWGDGRGLTGNNRYLDSWAGNADGNLLGSIRTDFSRYIDAMGVIRFLVYADRTGTNPDTQHNTGQGIRTFHDYMSLTVKQVGAKLPDLFT